MQTDDESSVTLRVKVFGGKDEAILLLLVSPEATMESVARQVSLSTSDTANNHEYLLQEAAARWYQQVRALGEQALIAVAVVCCAGPQGTGVGPRSAHEVYRSRTGAVFGRQRVQGPRQRHSLYSKPMPSSEVPSAQDRPWSQGCTVSCC